MDAKLAGDLMGVEAVPEQLRNARPVTDPCDRARQGDGRVHGQITHISAPMMKPHMSRETGVQ